MNNTLHTPAPWQVKYEKTGRTIDAVIKMGTAAVYFTRGIGQTFEEQQANARLISAAPDLLSALENLMARCVKDAEHYAPDGNEAIWAYISDASDAIAKAKGEA